MRLFRPIALAVFLVAAATPAYADLTFFVGVNSTPSNRPFKGFAFGGGGGMFATEFEYANNGEHIEAATPEESTPALRTIMGNFLVQTPVSVAGFQPYASVGAGWYRERLGTHQESSLAFDSGVGVKTTVFGPIKVRVDYRVLKLRGDPLYSTVHRVYSGFHLAF